LLRNPFGAQHSGKHANGSPGAISAGRISQARPQFGRPGARSPHDRKQRLNFARSSLSWSTPKPLHLFKWRAAMTKVTCHCGAIYEMIETKGSTEGEIPFKCVLCGKDLFTWAGINVGQFRLVWRPDQDRE
jgi:hypothetical protein